jgi:secondary thiamine-phosphate synthase enzyme
MRAIIELSTHRREELVDITDRVCRIVENNSVRDGSCALYPHVATAAIMIQENWDARVPADAVDSLHKLVPPGIWLHDRQDNNGDAHVKAGLVGPSETIPVMDGKLGLSTWQGVLFCEFDGPRPDGRVIVTVLTDTG